MKALILASGIGKRLQPLTNDIPKALVSVNGRSLLRMTIDSLLRNDIEDIVITTGYLKEKIEDFVKQNYPQINVEFAYNPQYETTNAIYSMWRAREYLKNDEVLYFHSDLFFDPVLLKGIINSLTSSCLVNKNVCSDKDFNAKIENGLIKEIGVKIVGEGVRFCLPIYKLLKDDFALWMQKIDEYIKLDKSNCYAELALNEVLGKIRFLPVYFDKQIGMEIDDFDDLKRAEEQSKKIIDKS